MQPRLSCHSVEVCYGRRPALRGVSFALAPGEILGVVGESGSGKSTLLRAVAGLLPPGARVTAGSLQFAGQELAGLSPRGFARLRGSGLGMIFQDAGASFCPVRTIGSQLYEVLAAHRRLTWREARQQALALFDQLLLQDGERIWQSYPFQLSGGMVQRVGIAAAMLLHPPVLLADEPPSALDAAAQRQVLQTLLRLRELYGTSILLVTHDMGVAARADTLLVLREGAPVEYGPAPAVLGSPQAAYTRQLLAAAPRLHRAGGEPPAAPPEGAF